MNEVAKQFGERLRQVRIERRLSVEQLAQLSRLEPKTIEAIERGASVPGFSKLLALASAVKVDPIYLLIVPNSGNDVHDLLELTRKANKATVGAMKAACIGVQEGMRMRAAEKHG